MNGNRPMQKIGRWLWFLLRAFLLYCLIVTGIFAWPVIRDSLANNRKLAGYEKRFHTLPHPDKTTAVSLKKKVGNLSNAGNSCSYFVGQVRTFAGNRRQLVDFYQAAKGEDEVINVIFPVNGVFSEEDLFHEENFYRLKEWGVPSGNKEQLYLVYFFDGPYKANRDLRCH